jgi:co-chaperonin GroES (HSP10)
MEERVGDVMAENKRMKKFCVDLGKDVIMNQSASKCVNDDGDSFFILEK